MPLGYDPSNGEAPAHVEMRGVMIQLHLYSIWTEVAVDHLLDARQDRLTGSGSREFRAGLQTVAAAAFALEGLKAHLVENVGGVEVARPSTAGARTNAGHRVLGTLSGSLGVNLDPWADDVVDLFELRNSVVHHRARMQGPKWHPRGAGVASEEYDYRLEVASDAVEVMLGVLDACAARPLGTMDGLAAMVADQRLRL